MLRELTRSMREAGEKALVAFLTAGYPDEETFLRLLDAASRAGCQIIEIGIPFSDPIADGPVIQESSKRALDGGMTLRKALALAGRASETNPSALVFMSYVNPILRMGVERFAEEASRAGVSGVVVPDVPFEESPDIRCTLGKSGITFVDLVAPTSSEDRVASIAEGADGFLYLVSLTGVTGVRSALSGELGDFVQRVRAHTDVPLYVGFGISGPELAAQAAEHADGVIIGSAIIRIVQSSETSDEAVENVRSFLTDVKRAIAR
jgi:tryptophan synthase alpha chain